VKIKRLRGGNGGSGGVVGGGGSWVGRFCWWIRDGAGGGLLCGGGVDLFEKMGGGGALFGVEWGFLWFGGCLVTGLGGGNGRCVWVACVGLGIWGGGSSDGTRIERLGKNGEETKRWNKRFATRVTLGYRQVHWLAVGEGGEKQKKRTWIGRR